MVWTNNWVLGYMGLGDVRGGVGFGDVYGLLGENVEIGRASCRERVLNLV